MQRILVLDTGPLLTWACLHFLKEFTASNRKRSEILREIDPSLEWSAVQQEDFEKFVSGASRRLVTGHVLTEAFRFRNSSWLAGRQKLFLPFLFGALHRVEERCMLFKDIQSAGFEGIVEQQFGFTDAAILCLAATAAQTSKERVTFLTTDDRLLKFLSSDPRYEILLTRHYALQ